MAVEDNRTYDEIINQALTSGPLPSEEVSRRAEILLYNEMNELFERFVSTLVVRPNSHPETRQILAAAANLANLLGEELLNPTDEESNA